MQKPTKHDLEALKRALRYLKTTWDLGLFYTTKNSDEIQIVTNETFHSKEGIDDKIVGYSDASFAEETGRKSRSAYVYMINGCAVTWKTKKQSLTALSSTEFDTYALSEACKEAVWLREFCKELGVMTETEKPLKIFEDNQSCIAIVMNPISHARSKHFAVRSAFIRDLIENKTVEIIWCPTKDMIADLLTKALDPVQHEYLTKLIGLRSLNSFQN